MHSKSSQLSGAQLACQAFFDLERDLGRAVGRLHLEARFDHGLGISPATAAQFENAGAGRRLLEEVMQMWTGAAGTAGKWPISTQTTKIYVGTS